MLVEMIPTYGKRLQPKETDIKPKTRKAFIELILIGIVTTILILYKY